MRKLYEKVHTLVAMSQLWCIQFPHSTLIRHTCCKGYSPRSLQGLPFPNNLEGSQLKQVCQNKLKHPAIHHNFSSSLLQEKSWEIHFKKKAAASEKDESSRATPKLILNIKGNGNRLLHSSSGTLICNTNLHLFLEKSKYSNYTSVFRCKNRCATQNTAVLQSGARCQYNGANDTAVSNYNYMKRKS